MTISNLQDQQATAILSALQAWLTAAPGRRFTAGVDADGVFFARLSERRAAGGVSLADALSQVATVAGFEVDL